MNIGLGIGIPFTRSSLWSNIFTPTALFMDGSTEGVWYDPSDLTTLYQDAAGTTPVTAVEQPVGLMLDKSKGLVLGPELVTNGDFSSGTTGWTVGAGWSVSGGAANASVSSAVLSQNSVFTSGKWYKLTFQQTFSTGSLQLRIAGAQNIGYFNSSGVITAYVYATVSGALEFNGTSLTTVIDNISVREIPGNHAYQTVSTKRGTLTARRNWLVGTETLATQTVTTRATPYILSFYGTGTVTLSGTSTAGPLVGTGANNRVYLEFTPTAGTLTLTVSGTVLKAQLEVSNEGL